MTVVVHLKSLIQAIVSGNEEASPFPEMRQEVQGFAAALAGNEPAATAAVSEYMNVPIHLQACQDLDYRMFNAEQPLTLGCGVLRLHHILEAFSRTSPARYAEVWIPVLDLTLAVCPAGMRDKLNNARNIVLGANHGSAAMTTTVSPGPNADIFRGVGDPGQALDGVMNNILSAFPGLQDMVQTMMTAGSTPDGVPAVMQQIQTLLCPLLTQATKDDPSAPNLQPAVAQILQGFSTLTESLAQPAPAAPAPPDASMDE